MTKRVLIIMPSWVGDVVMATPALRLVRDTLSNAEIHALLRPGLAPLLEGAGLVNHLHTVPTAGLLGPARLARGLQPVNPDEALLLTNSFATALGVRMARVPRRVGYDRDGRGFLLTERLAAPRDGARAWALVPAVRYYHHAAAAFLEPGLPPLVPLTTDSLTHAPLGDASGARLELGLASAHRAEAADILERAGVRTPYAVLNPGGNNPSKRWPAERFALLADHLAQRHGLAVVVNGSPAERGLAEQIARDARSAPKPLPALGPTLGALKGIIAGARLMVTNDTGPRHIAAAFGVPLVSLFGPTDPRWTTIPARPLPDGRPGEVILIANAALDPARTANEDPQGSRIDRIELDAVLRAVDERLSTPDSPA